MAEKKGRVLCVDDEPNIVRALQWLLQKDFQVFTANSGQDGLALIRQHDFDVVISDQRMPMMTGVEFLREVRKVSPRTMRILLTGYSDLQAILRSVNESEIYRFINKPWNISELPRVVEQAVIISRNSAVEPVTLEISEDAPIVAAAGDSLLLIDDNPEMLQVIRDLAGSAVKVLYAPNLADAIAILNEQSVSVVVSETRVGSVDATRLIRLMKHQHPKIVSVVLSGQSDAEMVTSLINQGQIYRFVPKPVRPGYLKLVIHSALIKHQRLVATPALAERHQVDATATGTLDALAADVQKVAEAIESAGGKSVATGSSTGLIGRMSEGFRRLFAR